MIHSLWEGFFQNLIRVSLWDRKLFFKGGILHEITA